MKIELIGSFLVFLLCVNSAAFRLRVLPLIVLVASAALVATKTIDRRLGMGLMCFIGGYLFRIYGVYISTWKSIAMLLLGLYLAGAHNDSASYRVIEVFLGQYTYALANFMSGFFIVYAVIFSKPINDVFSRRLPVFMGKVSFSVYVIHFPIISTLGIYLFSRFLEASSSYTLSALLASCITVAFTYGCSVFVYRYVDAQGMALSNSISKAIVARTSFLRKGE